MALSANSQKIHKDPNLISIPVEEAVHIYAGALVCTNSAGYAVPANDTAGYVFQGFAVKEADNTSGADGAINVLVQRVGILPLAITGATQATVGKMVYLTDDATVSVTKQTVPIPIGKVVKYVSATEVHVAVNPDLVLFNISELQGVTITTLAENQILKANSSLVLVNAADAT